MNKVNDAGMPHKYFSTTPKIIFTLGLTPFEFTLYSYLKETAGDNGRCWKSTERLAEETSMSAGMVSKVKDSLAKPRKELNGKALITITEEENTNGGSPRHIITITDIWPENMAKYYADTPSQHEGAGSRHEGAGSCGETKNNSSKKKRIKKVVLAAQGTPSAVEEQDADEDKIAFDKQTPQQRQFTLLAWMVGWDVDIITKAEKGQIAQTIGILNEGSRFEPELRRFWTDIWTKDWRWEKHRQRPTLKDIRTEIGKLTLSSQMPGPSAAAADWSGVPSFVYAQQENFY